MKKVILGHKPIETIILSRER